MSATDLPSAETLYNLFLAPWWPPEEPQRPELRGDLEEIELPPGGHIRDLCPLPRELREAVRSQLDRTTAAAKTDLAALLGRNDPPGIAWLTALEAHATPAQLQQWLRSSDPARPDNNYLVLVCETGTLIAHLLQTRHPRLRWLEAFPYFESTLFDLNRMTLIPVFHWAVKLLSGDDRQPLRDKIGALAHFLADED